MSYSPNNPNGQATSANSLPVVLASDQSTVPVSAASLPLPTGAATGAKQDTGNTSVASIDTKTPSLGQALAASSVPVTLTALEEGLIGALIETAPASDTASSGLNGRLQRIAQRLSTLITTMGSPFQAGGSIGNTAFIANAGTNLNTSALALDTTLTGGTQQTKITDGTNVATVKAASTAAVASDRAVVVAISPNNAITTTPADITATGNITTQNLVPAGTATAGSAVQTAGLAGMASASVQVTGTYTGALSAQATVDGSTWVTLGGTPFLNINTGLLSATITSATVGVFQLDVAGFNKFRITGLAAMTGTAVVSIQCSNGTSVVAIDAALPTGTNVIGALSANQSTNVAQLAGTTTDTNSGTKSAGTLRVVLATDQPALTNKLLVTPDSVALPANQSVNVAQMNGVATTMGNGVSGTGVQRVVLASDGTAISTAGFISAKIDQTTVGTTNAISLAQIGATTVVNGGVAGTLAVGGVTAAAATATGNPVRTAAIGKTANPTAVTDGQVANLITDKLGKQVVVGSIRDLKANQITTITASTSETTVVTAVASTFMDVYGCIVVNSSATATNVSFKDSTAGTTRFNIYVPAGDTRGFMLGESAAFAQTTVNNNWTATSSASVSSLVITMLTVKNT